MKAIIQIVITFAIVIFATAVAAEEDGMARFEAEVAASADGADEATRKFNVQLAERARENHEFNAEINNLRPDNNRPVLTVAQEREIDDALRAIKQIRANRAAERAQIAQKRQTLLARRVGQ